MAKAKKRARGKRGEGMVRLLPSGKYQASWKDEAGKYRTAPQTYANESDARRWLGALLMGAIADAKSGREKDGITLAEFSATWLDTRKARGKGKALSPRTKHDYQSLLDRIVLPAFGHRRLDSITSFEVHRWFYETLNADNPVQNAHAYSLFASIMRSAERRGTIEKSPCNLEGAGSTPRKRRPPIVTLEELQVIAENIPARYRAQVAVAAWCGLRSGEQRALRRRHLKLQGAKATVRVEEAVVRLPGEFIVGPPKSDSGKRVIRIPNSVLPLLHDHLHHFSESGSDGLVFPAAKGGFMHGSTMQKVFKKAVTVAGRPELTLHDMRHAAGTRAGQTGATLVDVMRLLGDSSPGAAMRYLHPDEASMDSIAEGMDAMIKSAKPKRPKKAAPKTKPRTGAR